MERKIDIIYTAIYALRRGTHVPWLVNEQIDRDLEALRKNPPEELVDFLYTQYVTLGYQLKHDCSIILQRAK